MQEAEDGIVIAGGSDELRRSRIISRELFALQ